MSSESDDELETLAVLTDDNIDLSDIPEVVDWEGAEQGKFFRPVKQAISIRLDADILAYFRSLDGPYQTRINEVLRRFVQSQRRKGG